MEVGGDGGASAGGLGEARVFHPQVPMLYIYGEKKPFMFHSRAWAGELAAKAGSRVLGLPTGHWVMIGRRGEFNEAVGVTFDAAGNASWFVDGVLQFSASGFVPPDFMIVSLENTSGGREYRSPR